MDSQRPDNVQGELLYYFREYIRCRYQWCPLTAFQGLRYIQVVRSLGVKGEAYFQ